MWNKLGTDQNIWNIRPSYGLIRTQDCPKIFPYEMVSNTANFIFADKIIYNKYLQIDHILMGNVNPSMRSKFQAAEYAGVDHGHDDYVFDNYVPDYTWKAWCFRWDERLDILSRHLSRKLLLNSHMDLLTHNIHM